MNRKFHVIAIAALAMFAVPAFGAEPGNVPSPSDTIANDLNAKQLQQVEQEQEKLNKEVEQQNEERMRQWRQGNEERYRQWQKEHPENQ